MEFGLFYLFSSVVLVSGLMVISARNPVHNVLFLVLTFCNATGLLLLLEVEFMALIFIVVYVGAIAVLFLFVVMMLNIKENPPLFGLGSTGEVFRYLPVGVLLSLVFLGEIFMVLKNALVSLENEVGLNLPHYVVWIRLIDGSGRSGSNLETLGQVLYTYYFYYFLVAGFILLVAMIGAIVLTLQSKPSLYRPSGGFHSIVVKRQQIHQQMSRDPVNAVFLVDRSVDKR